MKTEPRQPIIIIGMHRSGTTMVVEMLEKLGLFIGKRREQNQEALFFLRLNDWILSQSGATWDNPAPVHHLLSYPDLRGRVTDYLRTFTRSPQAASYLGTWRYLRHRSLFKLPFHWGWKDPRSTFTLPLWLDLFPRARILHVYRHGVDVAMSLRDRERGILEDKKRRASIHDILYTVRPGRANFTSSARCSTLKGGLALWQEHMVAAQAAKQQCPEAFLELRYEDLMVDPAPNLVRAAQFCGLAAEHSSIVPLVSSIRSNRSCAFLGDDEAVRFAQGAAGKLKPYGYDEQGVGQPSP